MIYLIDGGFRINSALNILINQVKYPAMYNECWCLSCKDKVNVNDKDNDNDNVNDNGNDKFIYLFGGKHPKVKPKTNQRSSYA